MCCGSLDKKEYAVVVTQCLSLLMDAISSALVWSFCGFEGAHIAVPFQCTLLLNLLASGVALYARIGDSKRVGELKLFSYLAFGAAIGFRICQILVAGESERAVSALSGGNAFLLIFGWAFAVVALGWQLVAIGIAYFAVISKQDKPLEAKAVPLTDKYVLAIGISLLFVLIGDWGQPMWYSPGISWLVRLLYIGCPILTLLLLGVGLYALLYVKDLKHGFCFAFGAAFSYHVGCFIFGAVPMFRLHSAGIPIPKSFALEAYWTYSIISTLCIAIALGIAVIASYRELGQPRKPSETSPLAP